MRIQNPPEIRIEPSCGVAVGIEIESSDRHCPRARESMQQRALILPLPPISPSDAGRGRPILGCKHVLVSKGHTVEHLLATAAGLLKGACAALSVLRENFNEAVEGRPERLGLR